MAFMGPKTSNTKKKSGYMVAYPPTFPDMAHGGHATSGHPAQAKLKGTIKKPK